VLARSILSFNEMLTGRRASDGTVEQQVRTSRRLRGRSVGGNSNGGSGLLDTVHGGIIEEAGAADCTFVVCQPFDSQAVAQSTVLDDASHRTLTTLRASKWLRHQCFFLTR